MGKIEQMKQALTKLKRQADTDTVAAELANAEQEARQLQQELLRAAREDERQADLAEYQATAEKTRQAEQAVVDAVQQVRAAWEPIVAKLLRAEEIIEDLARAAWVKEEVEEVPSGLANVVEPAPLNGGRIMLVGGPNDGKPAAELSGVAELIEMSKRKRLFIEL